MFWVEGGGFFVGDRQVYAFQDVVRDYLEFDRRDSPAGLLCHVGVVSYARRANFYGFDVSFHFHFV